MRLEPYRRVLALPGVRSLMVLALVARIPITAIGVTMTLHVAQDLDRGWGAAGLVGAALTVGTALGGPLNGRFVDRRGLRPMLVVTTVCEAVFWSTAPFMSYPVLLGGAFVAGVFSLPVFSVVRQSIAALVPADQRRQAYALDSMSVEMSFMAGPPLAVLLMSGLSGRITMWAIGGALVLAGVALYLTNPPVHSADGEATGGAPVRRRDWLTPRFLAVCAAGAATTLVLAGTDLGIVAMMRDAGKVELVGALLAAWGVYSLAGGFVYGALTRAVPLVALLGGLSLFTLPVGLVGDAWPLLFAVLIPAGVLCAPTLSASADLVSRLVPPSARGEAMGWHGSSLTVGMAIGSPLAGWAIDHGSPAWGFASVALVSLAVTALLLTFRHLDRQPQTPTQFQDPTHSHEPAKAQDPTQFHEPVHSHEPAQAQAAPAGAAVAALPVAGTPVETAVHAH
ncbi:MFS transporter [Dactylosporangium fulvum]|uniref:MFS transporter n=1 Tax=Dactylosporangium fulvum TaxID=53359 RepID=A0ABY5W578_9ACTN|nr:MFS transporter [Dactylosporangium fulvum]UWP84702.1 MFS transporter [Dactylosporangium fulvum]